jgi:hypothetical protein
MKMKSRECITRLINLKLEASDVILNMLPYTIGIKAKELKTAFLTDLNTTLSINLQKNSQTNTGKTLKKIDLE